MLTFTTIRLASLSASFLLHRQNCGCMEAVAPCPALKSCPAAGTVGAVGANRSVLSICSLYSEREMIQNMDIFTRSYHRGYILFEALSVPHREPYEILQHKILHEMVYRELVGKHSSFFLFISPKSSANICKLSLVFSHLVFAQRSFV